MTYLTILKLSLFCACAVLAEPQNYRTTPVPILKQINRHNDDGSYSYGYEAADGTFKIETKYPTGEVFGKYGYVGDDGKVREIEYGASKRGFEPAGTGINVPPPTLSDNTQDNSLDYDDGQYREDPTRYYSKSSRPASNLGKTFTNYRFASTTPPPAPAQPQYYNPQPHNYNYNSYNHHQPQQQQSPFNYDRNLFNGHPASNVNIHTGSYSLSYSG